MQRGHRSAPCPPPQPWNIPFWTHCKFLEDLFHAAAAIPMDGSRRTFSLFLKGKIAILSVRMADRDALSRGLPEDHRDCERPARVSQATNITAMLYNKAQDRSYSCSLSRHSPHPDQVERQGMPSL